MTLTVAPPVTISPPWTSFASPTSNAPTDAASFETANRELTPGMASVLTDTNVAYNMSTGVTLGDGSQASHWEDDQLTGNFIGLMVSTLNFGTIETVQESDLRAMELIGYDIIAVPEPSASHLLLLGLGGRLAFLRRRSNPRQKSVGIV